MSKNILITFMLVAAGCSQSHLAPQPPTIIKLTDSYQHAGQSHDFDKAALMGIAKDVLTEMYFTIEKADINNGLIRTRPLPGAQFFEFWRSDNVGADNTLAANLHTIRRTVTLNITEQKNELNIRCQANAQRLSLPEQDLRGSSRVYGMFSQSSRLLQRLKLKPEQAERMAWTDLGRDRQLEAEIIKRIESQIFRQAGAARKPTLRTTESKT